MIENRTQVQWVQCESCKKWREPVGNYGRKETFLCVYNPSTTCDDPCDYCLQTKCICEEASTEDNTQPNDGEGSTHHQDDLMFSQQHPYPASYDDDDVAEHVPKKARSSKHEIDQIFTMSESALPKSTLAEDRRRRKLLRRPLLLVEACRNRKFKKVKKILDLKVLPDAVALPDGVMMPATALFVAAQAGCTLAVQYLLDAHADANRKHADTGCTPLHVACANGHISIVETFLTVPSIDITQKDNYGATILHAAAFNSNIIDCIVTISQKKARKKKIDLNAVDRNGITPLNLVCQAGNIDSVKSLLRFKANMDIGDKDGATPLWTAAFLQSTEIVGALLMNKCNPNKPALAGDTPLWAACLTEPVPIPMSKGCTETQKRNANQISDQKQRCNSQSNSAEVSF